MMHTWRKSLESSPKLPSLYAEVEMIEKKRQTNAAHVGAGMNAPLLCVESMRMDSFYFAPSSRATMDMMSSTMSKNRNAISG